MDQIRQSMIKAAQELRALAITTTDLSLKHRLLEQADHLEVASRKILKMRPISHRSDRQWNSPRQHRHNRGFDIHG